MLKEPRHLSTAPLALRHNPDAEAAPAPHVESGGPDVTEVLARYWGYTTLRPLQQEAIDAGIDQRDSLVVLPTGGGKSLCYQVPPVVAGRTDVVVSPLISLMKDQVDALRANGYEAAALYSGMTEQERSDIARAVLAGKLRLLFVSPERLLTQWFIMMLKRANVSSFAIDEAHCISQWGHDFRPEYRRLAELRQHFPEASIHAFTATATERVRKDIIEQLQLKEPNVLVGRFDRPNLTYRVVPRQNLDSQIIETINAHKGEAAIVYCISRNETERVAQVLHERGIRVAPYHAGLDAKTRARTQEAFAAERLDVVVATVAFGMGIDRSNVRCVIHAAMPKSVEHYQQETGRAGRDGLEAECVLFFGNGDYRRWESLMTRSGEDGKQPSEVIAAQLALVNEMQGFCNAEVCRHKQLSEYFGQTYEGANCKACDVCLSDAPVLEGSSDIARTIIECVEALRVPFGIGHIVDVLRGAKSEKITSRRHDQLPLYGLLKRLSKEQLQPLVFQLVNQGLLHRSNDGMPVVTVTPEGKKVALGQAEVQLKAPVNVRMPAAREEGWRGVDMTLFDILRDLRRTIADERRVPPFVIFSDAVLRDMAAARPTTLAALGKVKGVGDQKLADVGARFVEAITAHVRERSAAVLNRPVPTPVGGSLKSQAFELFEQGKSLDEVAATTGRARSTLSTYLEDYVALRRPRSVSPWVDDETYQRVVEAASKIEGNFLKPIFEALGSTVSYDEIRVVMKHAKLR